MGKFYVCRMSGVCIETSGMCKKAGGGEVAHFVSFLSTCGRSVYPCTQKLAWIFGENVGIFMIFDLIDQFCLNFLKNDFFKCAFVHFTLPNLQMLIQLIFYLSTCTKLDEIQPDVALTQILCISV